MGEKERSVFVWMIKKGLVEVISRRFRQQRGKMRASGKRKGQRKESVEKLMSRVRTLASFESRV